MDLVPRQDVCGFDGVSASNGRLRILGIHDGDMCGNGACVALVLLPCRWASAFELHGAARLCVSYHEGMYCLHSGSFVCHNLFCCSKWRRVHILSVLKDGHVNKFLLIVLGVAVWAIVCTALYDAANVWLVRHSPSNSAYKLERLSRNVEMSETPILGSSRAEACYVPSVLGTNVFNYGVSGSCIRETLFHLRMVLERKNRGDIVVNLDPWGFAYWGTEKKSGFAGSYGLAALESNVRKELPAGLIEMSDWMPGIRFQGRLRENLTTWLNARKAVTKKVDQGAALIKRSRTEQEWKVIDATLKEDSFVQPNSEAEAELDMIGNLMKERWQVRVFWVVAPASPSYRRLYTGEKELGMFLARFHGQHRVVNLLANNEFGTDDFVDPTHLNEQGAVKFSRLLKVRMGIFQK